MTLPTPPPEMGTRIWVNLANVLYVEGVKLRDG
jgi:hypothetical protein